MTEGASIPGILFQFLFGKNGKRKPTGTIPSIKTDLKSLAADQDSLIWFGHSSYLIRTSKLTFLIDPVFSGNASPIPGSNKAFCGADIYINDDLPEIDYLLITHDHYDHVDYDTLTGIRHKVKNVICGLGVGAHLENWGYESNIITECDWNERLNLPHGITLLTTPARHFSGRGLKRNQSLWLSFLLITSSLKIYLGGDSGYDSHFKEIGEKYGPIDLAILENGQYDARWKYIHLSPAEAVKATIDLQANRLFPVHNSKFAMANHDWDEPMKKISEVALRENINLVFPMIGQPLQLTSTDQVFTHWWEGIQ